MQGFCTLQKNAPLTLLSRILLKPFYWNHHFLFFHSLPTVRMVQNFMWIFFIFFFLEQFFKEQFLGSQLNWEEGTETTHILPAPTHASFPHNLHPLVHLLQFMRLHCYHPESTLGFTLCVVHSIGLNKHTPYGTTDWFKIEKGVQQGCLLSSCFANAKHITRNAGLDELQVGIKISRRNINNLRDVDDTTLMAESKEKLKSFFRRRVKELA